MKTLEIKGIKVHIDDEDLAKALEESVAEKSEAAGEAVKPSNDVVSEQEAEILLKELEEWLAAGRSHVLNQARKELRKQYVGVGGCARLLFPSGLGLGRPRLLPLQFPASLRCLALLLG
jgi:phosphosulfolactate synthase (CoM biosynthesis protein A)